VNDHARALTRVVFQGGMPHAPCPKDFLQGPGVITISKAQSDGSEGEFLTPLSAHCWGSSACNARGLKTRAGFTSSAAAERVAVDHLKDMLSA
jgi:hypothetical protein